MDEKIRKGGEGGREEQEEREGGELLEYHLLVNRGRRGGEA